MSKRFRKLKATIAAKALVFTMPPKEKPAKLKLVTDTSCQGLGKMTWENVYNLLEKENPKVVETKAIVRDEANSESNSENLLGALANSFLHQVTTQANIFPYYDVIGWVIDNVAIQKEPFFQLLEQYSGRSKQRTLKQCTTFQTHRKSITKNSSRNFL